MAELSTLARPYARAAFEYAVGANQLAQWASMLSTVAAVCLDKKVAGLLADPSLSRRVLTQQFVDICGDSLSAEGRNFIGILAENKRLSLLPFINEQFQLLKADQERTVDVVIETAFPLAEPEAEQLKQALVKTLNRDVQVQTSVNESLIGGAVIRAGDTVIDGSIKSKLSKLSASLSL